MRRRLRISVVSCLLCLAPCSLAGAVGAAAEPPDRLYVLLADEDRVPDDPAAVVAFRVNDLGGLEREGLYPTGGFASAADSWPTPSVDAARGRLFVPNNRSNDVSVLAIRPDGSLEAVPGSPFPAGDGSWFTALHPSGRYLYVSQWREGTLGVYEVTELSELLPLQTVGPLHAGGSEIGRGGAFLYVADMTAGVRGYRVCEAGRLTELSGSPFSYPDMSRPLDVELASDGGALFVLDLDAGIAAFRVADSGDLDLVAGSPFAIGGFSSTFDLTPDDRHVYAHSGDRIRGFSVLPDGSLSQLPDSPFSEDLLAWALLAPPGTGRLYAGNVLGGGIRTYSVSLAGTLEEAGPEVPVADLLGRVPRGMALYRPGARSVAIDVKPDNDSNPIDPRSHGVVPVALLGGEDLDVHDVDVDTLRFGPAGAAPAHDLTGAWPYADSLRDVNLDGFTDLLAHFRTEETGIECGDTEATLTGRLIGGLPVEGADSIRTVGCDYRAETRSGASRTSAPQGPLD